ncbi:P-loop containing nucleoside triphosphate hydrolase protein [Phlegmacium glaucopus]|nr:P-loop containing nucleoside triphosphate hydrolase protein [Phlegmacium glaucopus]
MASTIRSLIDRFYPNSNSTGHRITILGLPNSGKTTLLYLLRTGEIVQTIPSIGWNIETVDVTTANSKTFRMTGWDIGKGCGGTYLYGIVRMYTFYTEAIIWLVDSSDRDVLQESVETLTKVLYGVDQDQVKTSKIIPILIFANKSDKPGAMSLDEIRIRFSKAISGRIASIFRITLTSNTNYPKEPSQVTGLPEAFDWLLLALDITKNAKAPPVPTANTAATPKPITTETKSPTAPDPRSPDSLSQKLESWLTRIETDVPPENFLAQFRSFTLPSWDHYTHIRIAYVMLTTYGRKDGKEMIFKEIEKYIAVSPQTTGKTFHLTMTYFWIQIVHFGIRNMPPTQPSSSTTTHSDTTTTHSVPSHASGASPDDFAKFLLINPHVVDGNLWADYYTKEVLMSPKAKAEMVLPDKKALPNLVIRDAISSYTSAV